MQSTQDKVLLLSIKPEYASKIFEGSKTVELRRVRPNVASGDRVMIYISSPVKALAGEFIVDKLVELPIDELWLLVKDQAGLNRKEFDSYYYGASVGYAMFLGQITKFDISVDMKVLQEIWEGFRPPQCYLYITQEKLSNVMGLLLPTAD